MNKILFFSIICFFSINSVFSQSEKVNDSLFKIVSTTKNDSVKVSLLNKLSFSYIFKDAIKAKSLLRKSEKIALLKNVTFGYNELVNIKGIYNDIDGNKDSAVYYFNKALTLSIKNKYKTLEARSTNNLGMYHWNNGNFNEAIQFFFNAIKINESLPLEKQTNQAVYLSNIGLIYQEMSLFEKALEYHQKAYQLRIEKKLVHEQLISLNNIGICYRWLKKNDLAIASFSKGIELSKKSNDFSEYGRLMESMGNSYVEKLDYKKALELYLQSERYIELGTTQSKSTINLYSSISNVYNELKNYPKAITYSDKALTILNKEPNLKPFCAKLYRSAATSNFAVGNVEKGDEFNEMYYKLLDESFSEKNSKSIAELETKYQTEKKEKLLLLAKAQNAEKELQIKRKNSQFIIAAILAIGFLILGFLIYRQQKLKNTQQAQEHELKSAILKIENQNKLQEQRLSISRDLHDNIGSQLTFIISSVDTVKHGFDIQNEKLDNKLTNISSFAKDTIVELRDTIWAMNSNEISYEDLEVRINNYIEKAKEASEKISFSFAIDNDLKYQKLTSVQGMNVYRTIQEAINNSLKYAEADIISVNIKKQESKTKITISDNGKGFDVASIEKGNGLNNMKKRIEEIGGNFNIVSNGNGTKVEVLV